MLLPAQARLMVAQCVTAALTKHRQPELQLKNCGPGEQLCKKRLHRSDVVSRMTGVTQRLCSQ